MNINIPAELTNFTPEKVLPVGFLTWCLKEDRDNGRIEIRNRVFSPMYFFTVAGIAVFASIIIGIFYYFISQFPKLTVPDPLFFAFIAISCVTAIFISGMLVYLIKQSLSIWPNDCRFWFNTTTNELFFARGNKRYSPNDYDTVVIGLTDGYNLRDLPMYQNLKTTNSSSSDKNGFEVPQRFTELFFLLRQTDGTWVRHLVIYDQNTRAIRRAALKLQRMLNCRLATRTMSIQECGLTQIPDLATKSRNDEIKKRSSVRIPLAIGSILIASGLGTSAIGLYYIHGGDTSSTWPSCPGTVLESKVVVHHYSGGGAHGSSHTTYSPEITYSYTVSEKQYTGNRYSYGATANENAHKVVRNHPVGSEVKVFYSPSQPGRSVLTPGVQQSAYHICIFGLVFCTIPAIVTFLFWRASQQLRFTGPCKRSEPVITYPGKE